MTAGSRPSNFVKSRSIIPPIFLCASRQNKKPAGAYRASGPMSANFDALLKPPRTRSCAVMVMMAVVSRGEIHSRHNIQEQAICVKRSDRKLAPACFRGIQGHGTLRGASAGPLDPGVPARYTSTRRSFRRNRMHSKVWTDMFVLALPVAEKILRPIVVYLFLIIGLRLAGKRELAQLNPFDFIVLMTLSNTVQNAIIGNDNSISGGIIGATTLLAVNYWVVRVVRGNRKLQRVLEGRADVLVRNGQI